MEPVFEKNTQTGLVRVTWPGGRPEAVSITTDGLDQIVRDINSLRKENSLLKEIDATAISMLEAYRSARKVAPERWQALQRLRRKAGLRK